jgi:menaquinone-dependent protoporphyrinogen oxidase
MPDVLLVYATDHGQTAKIAGRIADALHAAGLGVVQHDVAQSPDVDPQDYDGVIVGASVHRAHHQRAAVDWVKRHRTALEGRPSAFFSVSLTAADDSDESRAATAKCVADFLDDTGWVPGTTARFAGALMYREYDVFTRVLIRLIAGHNGGPTDMSRDHELTDWDMVARFAEDFAAQLAPVGAAHR